MPANDSEAAWRGFVSTARAGVYWIGTGMGFGSRFTAKVFWAVFDQCLASPTIERAITSDDGTGPAPVGVDLELEVYQGATARFHAERQRRLGGEELSLDSVPEPEPPQWSIEHAAERAEITQRILEALSAEHRHALEFIAQGGTYRGLSAAMGQSKGKTIHLIRSAKEAALEVARALLDRENHGLAFGTEEERL